MTFQVIRYVVLFEVVLLEHVSASRFTKGKCSLNRILYQAAETAPQHGGPGDVIWVLCMLLWTRPGHFALAE
jgi:hypothetical protein